MTITDALTRRSTMWWWAASISIFWGATLVFSFVDFAGEAWLGISWPTGPDLFPNAILGWPLAICQVLAAVLLLASAFRLAGSGPRLRGAALGILMTAGTSALCLVAYTLAALWYQADFMGRSL